MAYAYMLHTTHHTAAGDFTTRLEGVFTSAKRAEAAKDRLDGMLKDDGYNFLTFTTIYGHGDAGLGRVMRNPDGETYHDLHLEG